MENLKHTKGEWKVSYSSSYRETEFHKQTLNKISNAINKATK